MTGKTRDSGVVASGAVLILLGVAAYRFFSPSPHGYLELFVAVPMVVCGLGTAGLGLAFGAFHRALRVIGWLLIGVAAFPMLLAGMVFLSVAFDVAW